MSKERLVTMRKSVTITKATHNIDGEMDWIIMRNDGANDIMINFKADNMDNNYWTIKPSSQTPVMGISKDIAIHYKSVSGDSILEMILWA